MEQQGAHVGARVKAWFREHYSVDLSEDNVEEVLQKLQPNADLVGAGEQLRRAQEKAASAALELQGLQETCER